MMNNFIANIKAQLGTESSMDDFGVEKYAGSEVAEELLALDDMENLSVGVESMTEAIIGIGLMDQEVALESQGLDLSGFARFEGTLGNESLTNMVKRGGYNVVIAVKKLISKIWKFFIAIVDFFTICDGRWKSYSKLAKKYRGKINSLKVHAGEKEEDKTYNIRKVGDAANLIKVAIDGMSTIKRTAPAGNNALTYGYSVYRSVYDTFKAVVKAFGGTLPDAPEVDAAVNDGAKERLNEFKESFNEIIKEIRESDEKSADEAKKEILAALYTIETSCKKDLKWFKEYKKMSKDVEKAIEKLGKGESQTVPEEKLTAYLGAAVQMMAEFKKIFNIVMKEAGSCIQMVLADAAKLISGETRIGD